MDIQQAHLQLHAGMKLSAEHRDAIRAEILRSRLQSLDSPINLSPKHKTLLPDEGSNLD
jgi:protein arginine kinase